MMRELQTYSDLDGLPPLVCALFEEAGKDHFFLSLPWFRNLAATTLERNAALRIYAVGASGSMPDCLMVTRTPAGQNGSVLSNRSLGSRTLAGMTNYQTTYFGPLISAHVENPQAALQKLAEGIVNDPSSWTLVDFNVLRRDSPWFPQLVQALKNAGMIVRPYFYAGNWFEQVSGRSFDEYMKDRSSKLRNTIARQNKRLRESHRVAIEISDGSTDMDRLTGEYERVLRDSWKEPEPFPEFSAGLIHTTARAGALRVGLLRADGRPVATQIWIVHGGKATIYKLHYAQDFSRYSLGTILTAQLMQHVIEVDRVSEIDFGAFDEAHKAVWLSQRRELWGIAAFRAGSYWGARALARQLAYEAFAGLKSVAQAILRRA